VRIRHLIILLVSFSSPLVAADESWLMSIPYALSSEQVYKVRIERIDGVAVDEAIRYSIIPGEHSVTLSHLLDVEWSPDLVENPGRNYRVKDFTLNITLGKTYQLAVKVDINATAESQLDQSFWTPFIYRVLE
jgi:hypothetical protein